MRNDFIRQRRRKILERLVIEVEWRLCQRDKRYCYQTRRHESMMFETPTSPGARGVVPHVDPMVGP